MDEAPHDETEWGLVMPFVVCASHGGPYQDDAFVAGYYAGMIASALAAASAVGADRARWTVPTPLLPQLELIGMHKGFPTLDAAVSELPEWTYATFTATDDTDEQHAAD